MRQVRCACPARLVDELGRPRFLSLGNSAADVEVKACKCTRSHDGKAVEAEVANVYRGRGRVVSVGRVLVVVRGEKSGEGVDGARQETAKVALLGSSHSSGQAYRLSLRPLSIAIGVYSACRSFSSCAEDQHSRAPSRVALCPV